MKTGLSFLIFVFGIASPGFLRGDDPFVRGDANSSGAVDIADPICILNNLFQGGCEFSCLDAADADDNGAFQLTDGIFILNFLFLGGTPPPAPGLDCGEDPEDPNDELGCETFNGCG